MLRHEIIRERYKHFIIIHSKSKKVPKLFEGGKPD